MWPRLSTFTRLPRELGAHRAHVCSCGGASYPTGKQEASVSSAEPDRSTRVCATICPRQRGANICSGQGTKPGRDANGGGSRCDISNKITTARSTAPAFPAFAALTSLYQPHPILQGVPRVSSPRPPSHYLPMCFVSQCDLAYMNASSLKVGSPVRD